MSTQYPHFVGPTEANLREVAPNMYVGGIFSTSFNIKWDTVVDFQGVSADQFDDNYDNYANYRVVLTLPFDDGRPFPSGYLDKAWDAVQRAQGPILFHCAMGVSRSTSAIWAMLVMLGVPPDEAFRRIKVGRGPFPDTFNSAVAWVSANAVKLKG